MAPVWIPSTGPVRLTGYVPPTAITSDDAIFHLVWTYNKPLMVGRKRDVSVMDLHCLVTSKSLTKHTPTASTKPAPDCFMPSPQLKTFSSSALMSPTLLPKLHHQSKASTSIPTKPSSTGGLTIRNSLPSHLDLSSQSTLPCKDIQNHHDIGKNTLMPYYKTSAVHQLYTTMSLLWPHQQHTCCSHETSQHLCHSVASCQMLIQLLSS